MTSKPLDGILTLMTSRECVESLRVTGRMWPGLGDIVSLVKIVSLDFLERVNLINKRLEQERGEKFTFSRQYSSIGLYCAGYVFDHTDTFWLAPAHGLELLSCAFVLGSIRVDRWNAPL